MKKSKLITVMATVISVATVATACASSSKETKKTKKTKDDEEIEETEEDETEETEEETKKTKKTKATTEESTEDTTEEPTTTTEEETTTTTTEEETTTTTAETSDTAAPTSKDLGDSVQHSVGAYTYSFSKEWEYKEQNIYQYFFESVTSTDNFMMIYKTYMASPSQLKSYGYDAIMDEFNKQLTQQFGNGTLDSCTKTDGGDKDYYEDIVISGSYQGAAKKLPMRVILDKETGDCYVFCMFMDANLDSAKEAAIMEKYNACIASIKRS
ncbi:MAG TPA: hypothetical protein DEG74_05855 [Clostridiales bacterium]|nr:hypothetical protein [Clostridiales bacterium]HBZ77320.1 hypothetical protein [Clostridiales bacterium]